MNQLKGKGALFAVTLALLTCSCGATAHNVTSLVYDEQTDLLVVEIAYQGTHEHHEFSIQWGECRSLDADRSQIYGLVVDSDPTDRARKSFSTRLKIDMSSYSCRPSKLTLRTAAGFYRSVDIPKQKREATIGPR